MEHVIYDAKTKLTTVVPFTADELAAWKTTQPDPKIALLAYASAKRRSVVDAGTVVAVGKTSVPVWADAQSRAAMQELATQLGPLATTQWKGRDGSFYALDCVDMENMARAVLAFVQQSFATEAEMVGAINSGVITTTKQIDGGNWPAND